MFNCLRLRSESWAIEHLGDVRHMSPESGANSRRWGWVGNGGLADGLAVSASKGWVIGRGQQVIRKKFARKNR